MKILLSDIREGSRDLQLEAPLALRGLKGRAETGQVRAAVHVSPAGERWYLSAEVEGSFPFLCDRCGASFDGRLTGDFTLVVLTQAVEGFDPEESEEVILLSASTAELDLSEAVQESLILDLPMRLICREDCEGLCARCGANLNETSCDCAPESASRWSALEDLKKLMNKGDGESQAAAPENGEV